MNEVICAFSFTVKPENEAAYQEMLKETFAITKNESGTLMYEIFQDENGVYFQHERYADETAVWTHVQNTAKQLQQWFEYTEMKQLIVLGNVSDKFKEQYQVKEVYAPFKRVDK